MCASSYNETVQQSESESEKEQREAKKIVDKFSENDFNSFHLKRFSEILCTSSYWRIRERTPQRILIGLLRIELIYPEKGSFASAYTSLPWLYKSAYIVIIIGNGACVNVCVCVRVSESEWAQRVEYTFIQNNGLCLMEQP